MCSLGFFNYLPYTRHWSEDAICIQSFIPHNNSIIWYCHNLHLIDEETTGQLQAINSKSFPLKFRSVAVHVLLASHNIITISPDTLLNMFVYWFLETFKKKKRKAQPKVVNIFSLCVCASCLTVSDSL